MESCIFHSPWTQVLPDEASLKNIYFVSFFALLSESITLSGDAHFGPSNRRTLFSLSIKLRLSFYVKE